MLISKIFLRLIRSVMLMALVAGLLKPFASTHAQSNPNPSNANLISNGDFEDTDSTHENWIGCGGTQLADKQNGATDMMVHTGRYALRIGQPVSNGCGNGALGPNQVAFNDFTIPSDASDVTLSFWYSAIGDWPAGEMVFELSEAPRTYLGGVVLGGTLTMNTLQAGWHLYRQNLKSEDVAKVRGKTLYLTMYIRGAGRPEWNWAMYVDDMRIVPTRERTQAAPLPADLLGNGVRPIVLNGPNNTVYRIDTDGNNRIALAKTLLTPHLPTWSPDGKQIAFQTDWLEPENSTDTTKFPALIARAWLMNADGSGLRPLFRTPGLQGTKETPLGCLRFTPNTCADTGTDALDGLLTDLHWSPDGKQIAATVCAGNRWYNGDKASRDKSCAVSLYNVTNSNTVPIVGLTQWITSAQGASWSPGGAVLFSTTPSFANRPHAVWELNTNAQPAQTTQLLTWLTSYGSAVDLRSNPDEVPTWSPDGRYFITYREAQSKHYVPITGTDPLFLSVRSNTHIMLHDRQNLAKPRMLLLVDQGRLSGRPAWSPNGKYVVYTLFSDDDNNADIWWLNVQSGETGPMTHDGLSLNADWLPADSSTPPGPTVTPVASLTPNPSLVRKVYLPAAIRAGSAQPTPTATPSNQPAVTPVVFPTLTPTPQPTALPTVANPTAVPPRGISGRVLYKGQPMGGISVQLVTCVVDLPCTINLTSTTDSAGGYAFKYASATGAFPYTVLYRNDPAGGNTADPRYLLYWQQNGIGFDYEFARRLSVADFDIAEVELTTPADNASVSVPATFSWKSRGVNGDKYQWFMDATPDLFGYCDQQDADTNTSFTFNSFSCAGPVLALQTNTPYEWRVKVTHAGENGGVGQSHVRTFSFAP